MSKEIFEQPAVVRDTLRGRADITKGVTLEYEIGPGEIFRSMKNLVIVGCGSSRHAALVGEFFIESFARLHVDVDYASEFRYRDLLLGPDTLVVAVTQSGETADTLAAMQRLGIKVPLFFRYATCPGVRLLERPTPRCTLVPVRKLLCLQPRHSRRNWLFPTCLDFSSQALEPL